MRFLIKLGVCLILGALVLPTTAWAHSFGRMYNLPVPFWMYIYGGVAALLLSFLIVGFVATAPDAGKTPRGGDLRCALWVQVLQRFRIFSILRGLSLLTLLLCIFTGFFGSRDPYRNFNMTFFWVMFVLGFAYVCALLGNLYATLNPWQILSDQVNRVWRGFSTGRWQYPAKLGYWPALLLYMTFIWVELFGHSRPFSLSVTLSSYTAINLAGVWAWGVTAWFRHGEFFAVFLRLLALMAPVDYQPAAANQSSRLRWRLPFSGLLQTPATHLSLTLFVLFMLSSTAYDGLRATVPWFRLFWADPTGQITAWFGKPPIMLYPTLRPYYLAYESFWLLLSPFLYFSVYVLCVATGKWLARSPLPLRELLLRFTFSLLPIALVYHVTHYYTLILTQGVKIISLLSDPFGWGWNLFGTAGLFRAPYLPEIGFVWHSQVALILLGHIVSVYLAHIEALRVFPSSRAALRSQLPMLLLMVLFTSVGLWILAQPIQSGL